MAESRNVSEVGKGRGGAAASRTQAAPAAVVIRRARKRPEEKPTPPGMPSLNIGNRRVATAIELTPEALALFDPNPFAYASLPVMVAAEPAPAETPAPPPAPPARAEEATPAATPVAETTPTLEAAPPEPAPIIEPDPILEPVIDEPPPAPPVEEEDFSDKVSPDEAQRITDDYTEALLSRAEAPAAPPVEAPEEGARRGGARVLGRIDLTRKPAAARPAQQPAQAAPGTAPAKPAKEGESEADKGRKKKRKVVRKEDMFDALERAYQVRPRKKRAAPGQKLRKTEVTVPKASKRVVRINAAATASDLAKAMGIKVGEVLGSLMRAGEMRTANDLLDIDTATLVAEEFGYTVENTAVDVDTLLNIGGEEGTEIEEGEVRPPVVTVMGHVDHGKTSLLDSIRKANVIATESGGITQHIGAYMVESSIGPICFLDTPGHAAFTAMRSRGAQVTDIAVLVVAADDGVMPQTIESINHAKAADVPVIVAVNKIDKPDANPDRVKQQLTDYGLQPEEWGGTTQFVPVSALKGTGIDELLEAISLQAELLELRAPADSRALGTVVEARLDRGRGPVATVLVQKGTLKHGDHFVCGEIVGRVRAMNDHAGRPVKQAGPSTPVEIIGLDGVPSAGDAFVVVEDPSKAAQVAEMRREATRKSGLVATTRMSLEDLQRQFSSTGALELRIVIKADVDGSVEAIKAALEKLSNDEITLRVIHGGVGAINESDVQLAMASNAIIVGFHVRPEAKARALAERETVDIRLHSVIYELIDEVKAALEGMLAPEYKEVFEGRAEVRNTFTVPGGTIAGCYVLDGSIIRNHDCRLLRDNVVVYKGKVGSLRRFKDDAREVAAGYECGIGLDRFNDVKVGDIIETFRQDAVKRTLQPRSEQAARE
ncbi:MAG TPA: translation initiation factor IF-2 [Candidatus Limnocylindrales bacterium]|nr:translation initiation factor IF-2 [Candidatus Limnocylindrales bacterium]